MNAEHKTTSENKAEVTRLEFAVSEDQFLEMLGNKNVQNKIIEIVSNKIQKGGPLIDAVRAIENVS